MSAFDDEFGLFSEEAVEEEERRSTLGARKIATGETVIDDVEPEDERPARRPRSGPPDRQIAPGDAGERWHRRPARVKREPLPVAIAHPRAMELLTFLAKRLVAKPDRVMVELHPDARGAVLELEVDPEDIGKVIGRGGRVAQALRTIVRAGAEGRVTIDIIDGDDDEDEHAVEGNAYVPAMANGAPSDQFDESPPQSVMLVDPAKAKKTTAKKAAAKKRTTKKAPAEKMAAKKTATPKKRAATKRTTVKKQAGKESE